MDSLSNFAESVAAAAPLFLGAIIVIGALLLLAKVIKRR